MWELVAYGVLLAGRAIYTLATHKEPPRPQGEVQIPRVEEGATIPIVFGRTRVRQPILIGASEPSADYAIISTSHDPGEPFDYGIDMTFAIGIAGFPDGLSRLHTVFAGDIALPKDSSSIRLDSMTGDGFFETTTWLNYLLPNGEVANQDGFIGGNVEFLNGNSGQVVVFNTFPYGAQTVTGENLAAIDDASRVPGLRGYLCAQLFETGGANQWTIGRTPDAGAYSFEVSCYPSSPLYRQKVGIADANPADVIYWLLKGELGALGLDGSLVDYDSFLYAAQTLDAEGHGYSRAFESSMVASDMIAEVLRQIDAVLYEDPRTGSIKIRLIRQDYVLSAQPSINPNNCVRVEQFQLVGASLPNKILVTFQDSANGYRPGSAATHSFVGAVGQATLASPVSLDFPGCSTQALADQIVSREASKRSRPLRTFRAIVDRSFFYDVPGDVRRFTWPEYGLGDLPVRVARVSRGNFNDNTIALELVEEYFSFHRFEPDAGGTGLPTHGGLVG